MPAAVRVGDSHTCPLTTGPYTPPHVGGPVTSGSPTVLVGGRPAARTADLAHCNGPPDHISSGSATVLVNGRPAARVGDGTAHGGTLVAGLSTVLIG